MLPQRHEPVIPCFRSSLLESFGEDAMFERSLVVAVVTVRSTIKAPWFVVRSRTAEVHERSRACILLDHMSCHLQ